MLHPCAPFVPLASLLTSQVLNTLVSRLLPIFFHVKIYSCLPCLKNQAIFSRGGKKENFYIFLFFSFFFSRLPEKEIIFDLYKYNARISWKLINEIIYCIEHVSWSRTYVLPSIEFTNLKPEAPVLYYPDESTSF